MSDRIVNDYRIVVSGSDYTAPELRRFHLQGIASWLPPGAPNKLTSSPIVSIEDGVVTTRSGSRYVLGTRNSDFPTWEELRAANRVVPMD